jgi:hypothetical protein
MDRTENHGSWASILRKRYEREGSEQFFHHERQIAEVLEHPGFIYMLGVIAEREARFIAELKPAGSGVAIPSFEAHLRAIAMSAALEQVRDLGPEILHIASDERAKLAQRQESREAAGAAA